MWALAKLGYQRRGAGGDNQQQLQRHMVEEVEVAADKGCHGLSNSGGGRSGHGQGCSRPSTPPAVLKALCSRLLVVVGQLQSQEVANSLWALGALGKVAPRSVHA